MRGSDFCVDLDIKIANPVGLASSIDNLPVFIYSSLILALNCFLIMDYNHPK